MGPIGTSTRHPFQRHRESVHVHPEAERPVQKEGCRFRLIIDENTFPL
jgi:hypothetical protein